MATITQVLGEATKTRIEFDGKLYHPRKITWGLLSELEQWLIDKARSEFVKTMAELCKAGALEAATLTAEVKAFVRSVVDEGQYAFGSPAMMAVLSGGGKQIQAGQMKLIMLVLNCSEDDIIDLFVNRHDEVMAYVQQIVAESMLTPKP